MKRNVVFILLGTVILAGCSNTSKAINSFSAMDAEDEVNLGYGSIKKNDLTTSVAQINVGEDGAARNDIWEYIRGNVPGVEVGYSADGSTPDIYIRGISSITGSSTPLFIVDGMETPDLSFLNPSEVDNISIIKDGSASIYGSRGANGVILITTKAAKELAAQRAAEKKAERQAKKAAKK